MDWQAENKSGKRPAQRDRSKGWRKGISSRERAHREIAEEASKEGYTQGTEQRILRRKQGGGGGKGRG